MKKVLCIIIPIFIVVTGGIGGLFYYLGQRSTPANSDISKNDKAFIKAIEQGLEKRTKLAEKNNELQITDPEKYNANALESYKDFVEAEKGVMQFEEAEFDSPRLQKLALDYIAGLKLQEEALTYKMDDEKFSEKWGDGYKARCVAATALNDEFGVKVPESALKDFKSEAKSVKEDEEQKKIIDELIKTIVFEKVKSEYSYTTYATTVENTTPYEFDSLTLDIALIKDDVVQETEYASAKNWKPGQKVKLDFMTDCKFDNYTIDYNYYLKKD